MQLNQFTLGLLGLGFIVSPAFADQKIDYLLEGVTLRCTGSAQYMDLDVKLDITTKKDSGYLGSSIEKGKVVLAYSATECEDTEELRIEKKDFYDLIYGREKSVSAEYRHEEPDVDLKLQVECNKK